MPRVQPTVQDAQGNTLVLDPKDVPPGTRTSEVQQRLKALGYTVLKLEQMPEQPGLMERAVRAAPATAGMIRGGALGGELGGVPGAIAGAGIGAAGGEGLYAGAQRLFGMKGGEQPIGPRMLGAGESGALGEAGIRGAGAVGRGIFGASKAVGQALMPAKAAAEVGFGGVRDAAVTSELMKQLEARGGAKDAITFARQIRGPLRQMLRETERAFGKGTAAQKQALEPTLNSLRQLGLRTLSLAPLAQAISKDPTLLADLVRKQGPEILPELQAAWLTAAIGHATGKAGLSRGLLNVGELQNTFAGLGDEGQRALFSRTAPSLQRLFQTIQETGGLPGGGEMAKEGEAAGSSALMKVTHHLLGRVGLGGLAAGAGGGAMAVEAAMHGHPVAAVTYATMPFIMGRLMQNEAGIQWLTKVAVSMRDARMFTQVAPALAREGVQILGGAGEPRPQPRARLGPSLTRMP